MYLLINSTANSYLRSNTAFVPSVASYADDTYFIYDTADVRSALAALGWISVITEADVAILIQSNFIIP